MKLDYKNLAKKLSNILFVFIIILAMTVGLVRTVFLPKDMNYYENRYSEKIIAPTKNAIMDSSFQDSIENSLADQIPKAQDLKKIYNDLTSEFINSLLKPIIKSNNDRYINYKGMQLFGDGIVYATYDLEEIKSSLDDRAQNYNAVFKKYPDVDYYIYYIEKDTDINFETNEKINADEYLFSLFELEETNKAVFEVNDYNDFQKYFYKTDHHWNNVGSYKAYKEILNLLGSEFEPVEFKKEVVISKEFLGSKAAETGSELFKEDFCAYVFEFPSLKISVNGKQAEDYGLQDEFIDAIASEKISYGNFYGGDNGETVFDSGRTELDNILLIGESYDNAVLKLLATHYNKLHSIDLRNYEHYFGKTFDFGKYIEENDIDKVLFIGNINFYTMKEFSLESN